MPGVRVEDHVVDRVHVVDDPGDDRPLVVAAGGGGSDGGGGVAAVGREQGGGAMGKAGAACGYSNTQVRIFNGPLQPKQGSIITSEGWYSTL